MLGERIKFLSLTAVETLHLRLPAQRVLLGIVGCCRSLLASQAMFKGFEFNRSEEHTSELQSLMRISYAVFCLKKKNTPPLTYIHNNNIYNTKTESPTTVNNTIEN